MKKSVFSALTIFLLLASLNIASASPIARTWIYTTILIESEAGERGTGFLVCRDAGKEQKKIFLCTNKHVLGVDEESRRKASAIICWLNVKTPDRKIVGKRFRLGLTSPKGEVRWREHSDKNVDVLALDITDLILENPDIEKKWADYSLFANDSILASQEITIGEEILTIGYPLGKSQGDSNFPMVRQGIIASQIGQPFSEDYRDPAGNPVHRIYRGFLIDAGSMPGASGSPVVLKPATGRLVGNRIVMDIPPPYLLGIMAAGSFGNAGLCLVYDAATVKETIELFFN